MFTRKAQTGLTAKALQEAQIREEKKSARVRWQFNITPDKGFVAVNGVLLPF